MITVLTSLPEFVIFSGIHVSKPHAAMMLSTLSASYTISRATLLETIDRHRSLSPKGQTSQQGAFCVSTLFDWIRSDDAVGIREHVCHPDLDFIASAGDRIRQQPAIHHNVHESHDE